MIAPPEWLSSLFAWVIRATCQASVLIVLVLLAQYLLRKVVPAQWRYALWILVLLRLALPFSFESPVSVFNYASPASIRDAAAVRTKATRAVVRPALSYLSESSAVSLRRITPESAAEALPPGLVQARPADRPAKPSAGLGSPARVLPFVWILGIAALFLRMFWANGTLASRMRHRLPLTDNALLQLAKQCAQEVGLRQTPWIMKAPEVLSPSLFGFSVPRLLLPADLFEKFSRQELRYIFLHEFCHVRRRDIALNWISAIIQILHWFNPLVWFALARMRSDRELACDAQVLSSLEGSQSKDYGRTIIHLLESFSLPARAPGLVGILEDRGQMKRRLRMISRFGEQSFRWRWVGLAGVALLAVAVMTDARAQRIPAHEEETAALYTLAGFKVLDGETGAPIEGATLNGKHKTDSHGKGEIDTAFPGFVLVRASGYIPRQIEIEGEEYFERVMRMERATTIGGVVRDEDGRPIGNAEVEIIAPWSVMVGADRIITMTDAEGRWRCTEAPKVLDGLLLHLFHPDHATTRYSAGVRTSRGGWNGISTESLIAGQGVLVMKRGFTVSGTVFDLRGMPIEGAVVTMGFASFPEENRGVANTDRNGRFIFRNGSAATTALKVQARGFVVERKSLNLSPGMPEIRLIMIRGEILRVRVIDGAGNPVPGAILMSAEADLREKTDADGRVLWISAPRRPLMVHVRARGFPESDEAVEAGDRENLIALRALREIRVSGRVVDAVTRRPVPEFQVLVSMRRVATAGIWQCYRPIAEGKGGSFSFPLRDSFRPTGTVVQGGSEGDKIVRYVVGLKIKADGYFPDTSQTVAIENGDADLEVALEPGTGLAGVVRLPGGEPASGANVHLCGKFTGIMEAPDRLRFPVESPETLSDQSGRFQFDPEPDVRAIIVVHEKGFALVPADHFSAPLAVTLEPWGRIEGTLRVGNLPGSGEDLLLENLLSGPDQRLLILALKTQTDAEGRFAFSRVPPGVHSVRKINRFANSRLLGSVQVDAGASLSVNLGGNGRPVVGRVVVVPSGKVLSSDRILGHLESVERSFTGFRYYPAEFEADGSFRIEDVAAGNYLLRYRHPADSGKEFTIKVSVPEMPGGRSDKPLDLGTITAQ